METVCAIRRVCNRKSEMERSAIPIFIKTGSMYHGFYTSAAKILQKRNFHRFGHIRAQPGMSHSIANKFAIEEPKVPVWRFICRN